MMMICKALLSSGQCPVRPSLDHPVPGGRVSGHCGGEYQVARPHVKTDNHSTLAQSPLLK